MGQGRFGLIHIVEGGFGFFETKPVLSLVRIRLAIFIGGSGSGLSKLDPLTS